MSSILHLLPLIHPIVTCVDPDPYSEYGFGCCYPLSTMARICTGIQRKMFGPGGVPQIWIYMVKLLQVDIFPGLISFLFLSQALVKKSYADLFASEDGSLHALVGLLTGKDSAKQPLALYCLANLAAAGARPLQLARAAGPYLITHLNGDGRGSLSELAATVLANLAMASSSDRQAVRVLVNQDVVPTLVKLTGEGGTREEEPSTLVELGYQALYHIIIQSELEAESLNGLVSITLGRITVLMYLL